MDEFTRKYVVLFPQCFIVTLVDQMAARLRVPRVATVRCPSSRQKLSLVVQRFMNTKPLLFTRFRYAGSQAVGFQAKRNEAQGGSSMDTNVTNWMGRLLHFRHEIRRQDP